MAELVIGFFQDGKRIGSETIPGVMDRLSQRAKACKLKEDKYPQADTVVGLYKGWSGNDSFTIRL